MNSIKKQFLDLKKTTPKHIQWLLLAAAFVVVLILLTLLVGNKDNNTEISNKGDIPVNLIFNPAEESINWADTIVGDTKKQTIKISATAPASIIKVRANKEISGFYPTNTCVSMKQIDENIPCSVILEYKPSAAQKTETLALFIDWHSADEPEKMFKSDKIVLVLGATAPEVKKPEPKIEPVKQEVKSEPAPQPVMQEVKSEPAPIKQQIKKEIETVSAGNIFDTPKSEPEPIGSLQAEQCSDFAFPGYNLSGDQFGWIKPDGGAYLFHPFSDTKCNNPTGKYNPDNGLITDIKDPAKKIGTDAENIGYANITGGAIPELSNPVKKQVNRATQLDDVSSATSGGFGRAGIELAPAPVKEVIVGTSGAGSATAATNPYDRTYVLRQYKPIPATIVSEVRADPSLYKAGSKGLPVIATVDRNVYSDNGRTVVIPTGTQLMGYVKGKIPGPYQTIGRMDIRWYQFILPNGMEFNFSGNDPFSADSQGRVGVPGYGSTDYLEQMLMPMLTAIVPAAVNIIAPITDTFINQIDLDNNTVVQSGTVRSSELAKNEIITAWNQVAQKLMVDALDNTTPPFSIAAGTRITVFSPEDLIIHCGEQGDKECNLSKMDKTVQGKANKARAAWKHQGTVDPADSSWIGQARSFNLAQYCIESNGVISANTNMISEIQDAGYDFATVEFYCKSSNYQAINNAKQDAIYQNQQDTFKDTAGNVGSQQYNENILGLEYDENKVIKNPYEKPNAPAENAAPVITCEDGNLPDANGCCVGETFTDMGEQGFNCCPAGGGDCFPPIL